LKVNLKKQKVCARKRKRKQTQQHPLWRYLRFFTCLSQKETCVVSSNPRSRLQQLPKLPEIKKKIYRIDRALLGEDVNSMNGDFVQPIRQQCYSRKQSTIENLRPLLAIFQVS
jgi:hypothetical protein